MTAITFLLTTLLLILSGLFSGLNLGLLGLNVDELERKAKLGNAYAKAIYPIRKRGNLLLCTLLLGNVAVNSMLSIFLGSIINGVIAVSISTLLIVIFGEILPQSFFSRHALKIGAKTIPITKLFIFILFPISFPLSWILDKMLGNELPNIWSKEELKEIIKFHEDSPNSNIDEDEERILIGALSFSHKKVSQIMTPRTMIFCLEKKAILNQDLIKKIIQNRHTRIPVFKERVDNIIGIINIKDLLGLKLPSKISNIDKNYKIIKVSEDTPLDTMLNTFLTSHSHIAFVYDEFAGLAGIVTLEDVIEEIIQKEVYDEGEKKFDPRKIALEKASTFYAEQS